MSSAGRRGRVWVRSCAQEGVGHTSSVVELGGDADASPILGGEREVGLAHGGRSGSFGVRVGWDVRVEEAEEEMVVKLGVVVGREVVVAVDVEVVCAPGDLTDPLFGGVCSGGWRALRALSPPLLLSSLSLSGPDRHLAFSCGYPFFVARFVCGDRLLKKRFVVSRFAGVRDGREVGPI